ncbi:unnamed protein product (macronuclear) [Paramecium tetraurelia]|uniref:Uncharacterized protein n=1 Tax=Paramecium tetraurelia TaxID=5888 RepID=A0BCY3_PARTE|nr:uncharacterized protein GSPATT00004494001 [Paramecium tetraurelia]CAK56400.1 unnamed protein product [Paramecium tetraurelia]|eukprot:XP_001423798.1 hypothetical protein (macronuclear) [Paramecium tetraurelia strain d4-2]
MQNFQEETLVRSLISNICRPIVEKIENIQKEVECIQFSIHQHDRKIDILSDKSDQLAYDMQCTPIYSSKLNNDAISNLRMNIQDDEQKVFDLERHFNLEFNKTRLEQGAIKLEQENQKKEIKILGDIQQSLTERVEIYNNYLSQKLYQQEFSINNVDTSNSKVVKQLTETNLKNQEEISSLNTQTKDLLSKIQYNEQEILKIQCSKQWMQDMIVELRQKSQFFLTIDQIDVVQQSQTPIRIQHINNTSTIQNQVDLEKIQEIIDDKFLELTNVINAQIQQQQQQSQEQLKSQLDEFKITLVKLKNESAKNSQSINSYLKDSNEKIQNAINVAQDSKIKSKQQINQLDELIQKQLQKITQDIQTIQINITGLDLRMAETHIKVVNVQEKQHEIQVHQTSFSYLNNQNEVLNFMPMKQDSLCSDSFLNNNVATQKMTKTEETIQAQLAQQVQMKKKVEIQIQDTEQMPIIMQNLDEQDIYIKNLPKIQNDIIKLKSDFFNEQQYNQNQMTKLLKSKSITDQSIKDIDQQLRQFNQYFNVIFSLILHNELIGTDNQAKVIGNGFKFEFIPFQQDEKTIMTYQNNKIAKVDLLMKTITSSHSIIKKQRQNTFDFQQDNKKRLETETSRELKTMYSNKKYRLWDDKQITQTERLNLSVDATAYQQLPKQKVKRVLVKYKRLLS